MFIHMLHGVIVILLTLVRGFLIESWNFSVSQTLLAFSIWIVFLAERDNRRLNTVRFELVLVSWLLHHQISFFAFSTFPFHFLSAVAITSTSSFPFFGQFSESKPRFAVLTTSFLICWQTESEFTGRTVCVDLAFTAWNGWVALGSILWKDVISCDYKQTLVVIDIFAFFLEFLVVFQRVGDSVAGFAGAVQNVVNCAIWNVIYTKTH